MKAILYNKHTPLIEVTMERKQIVNIGKVTNADKYAKQQEADAKLYETQREAEAKLFERQKNAEAEKYEQEQKAEAEKATADAVKYTMEQEADGIRSKGLAEAEAIKASLYNIPITRYSFVFWRIERLVQPFNIIFCPRF